MADQSEPLSDLTSEELTALVELAEAYQRDEISRRNILKLAGLGGLAGVVGGASASAGIEELNSTNGPDSNAEQSIFAPPGEVQDLVDTMASNGGGLVRLDPTQRYEQPSSPWAIKEDVILDFNGAFLIGTGDLNDTDLIHVYPGAQVHNPRIDLYNGGRGYTRSNGYRARVISLDTQFGGSYFAYGTTVRNGVLRAAGDTGVGCYIGVNPENSGSADAHISHLNMELDIGIPKRSEFEKEFETSLNTACHIDTAGAGKRGWINGIHLRGNWRYPKTGILQTGVTGEFNQQILNDFQVQIQPGKDANAFWEIKDPTFARLNRWRGVIWDIRRYDDYAWKIDSEFFDQENPWRACKQNAVETPNPNITPGDVRNRSPSEHYINNVNNYQTMVV